MYDAIRQLIRQNRLRKAMHDMRALDLSREHASRLVTLDRRLHIIENKKIGNLSEDRLLTIEENGLVQDILVFLDQVEFPQRNNPPMQTDNVGAAAGAKEVSKNSMGKWLGLAAGILALLTVGFFLWPDTDNTPTKASPTEMLDKPTGDIPTTTITLEERKKLAQQAQELEDEKRKQEALDERERLRRIAEAKKEAATQVVFMNRAKQVDMAVAVYTGPASLTKVNANLTKSLSSFLERSIAKKTNSPVILNSGFHNSKERELLIMGQSKGDKRLNPKLARYLVLADVRNVDKEGKGELRMCIYNTSTGKALTRIETADVGTAPQMQEKYILYAVKAFVTEKLKL